MILNLTPRELLALYDVTNKHVMDRQLLQDVDPTVAKLRDRLMQLVLSSMNAQQDPPAEKQKSFDERFKQWIEQQEKKIDKLRFAESERELSKGAGFSAPVAKGAHSGNILMPDLNDDGGLPQYPRRTHNQSQGRKKR